MLTLSRRHVRQQMDGENADNQQEGRDRAENSLNKCSHVLGLKHIEYSRLHNIAGGFMIKAPSIERSRLKVPPEFGIGYHIASLKEEKTQYFHHVEM